VLGGIALHFNIPLIRKTGTPNEQTPYEQKFQQESWAKLAVLERYDILHDALQKAVHECADAASLIYNADMSTYGKAVHKGNIWYAQFKVKIRSQSNQDNKEYIAQTILQSTINTLLKEEKLRGFSEPTYKDYPRIMVDEVYPLDSLHVAVDLIEINEKSSDYIALLDKREKMAKIQHENSKNKYDQYF
jgi:hypothetical protein